LGFPTANIRLPEDIDDGIYISMASLDNKVHPSLTFIGSAKTFKETDKKAEIYFLSLNEDIYGKKISVKLLKKIRENMEFKSADELIAQMEKDKIEAEKYFSR